MPQLSDEARLSRNAKRRRYVAANRAKINARQQAYHRKYYETVTGRIVALLGVARVRARKRGLQFELTREWVEAKLLPGKCELTGIPFDLSRDGLALKFRSPFAPSIDRKDNAKGYTENNCRMVCVVANYAMNEWGLPPVLKLAAALVAMQEAT